MSKSSGCVRSTLRMFPWQCTPILMRCGSPDITSADDKAGQKTIAITLTARSLLQRRSRRVNSRNSIRLLSLVLNINQCPAPYPAPIHSSSPFMNELGCDPESMEAKSVDNSAKIESEVEQQHPECCPLSKIEKRTFHIENEVGI